MPKSRLLSNSNNYYDDKEFLIPNQHDKKSGDSSVNNQKQSSMSINSDGNAKISTAATGTTTSTNRLSSRSIVKRPVSSTSASNVKPNTILSLEDRDIVVIDNIDYNESTSNEATVIVVEKPRKLLNQKTSSGDIDLAELLESNWPASAGDIAVALNNRSSSNGPTATTQYNFSSGSTSTSNSSISCLQGNNSNNNSTVFAHERNRSKNPLSHIGQSKLKRNTGNNISNFNITGNLINLDSDGSSASGSNEHNHNPSKL